MMRTRFSDPTVRDILQPGASLSATEKGNAARNLGEFNQTRVRRGLARGKVPTLAVSPPTVGALSAPYFTAVGSTSAIANHVTHLLYTDTAGTQNTAKFRFLGWPFKQRNAGGAIGEGSNFMSPSQFGTFCNAIEFLYYGTALELCLWMDTGGYGYQIWVDGSPLTTSGQTLSGGTLSASYNLPITFSSAGFHTIKVRFAGLCGFTGVSIGPQDTLLPTAAADEQIYLIGDSYVDGANGVAALDTYAHQFAALMGVADFWAEGQGGTGIVANGSNANKSAYQARIVQAGTLTRLSPHIVVIQGSTNDASQSPSAITSATQTAIATARSQWPAAFVAVTGVLLPSGSLSAGNIANNTAVKTGATGADLFIDAVADGWYAGAGTASAPTGSGNADIFLSSDTVHGTPAWHTFAAQMLTQYIATAIK